LGTRERRERERVDLRERIMDAARQLFATEGYAAVSMRRIADAIEYSPTAIYVHFRDKEALIRELVTDDFGRLAGAFDNLADVADPIERLRRLGRLYVRFAVEHPNHYKLMFMTEAPPAGPTDGEPTSPDAQAYNFLLHTVSQGMVAGRYRAGLTDAHLAAQTVWAAVHGVASLQIAMASDPCIPWVPLADRTAAAVDGILDGLLAPARSNHP
jgi:AcrR family transcriptional regulator